MKTTLIRKYSLMIFESMRLTISVQRILISTIGSCERMERISSRAKSSREIWMISFSELHLSLKHFCKKLVKWGILKARKRIRKPRMKRKLSCSYPTGLTFICKLKAVMWHVSQLSLKAHIKKLLWRINLKQKQLLFFTWLLCITCKTWTQYDFYWLEIE